VDKRTIIAVMLIALLFIVYTMITRSPKKEGAVPNGQEVVEKSKEEKVSEEKIKGEGKKEDASKKEKKEIVEAMAVSGEEQEEKLITVKTNLYTATFSTKGAAIKSMKLMQYPGVGDEPVELIPEEGSAISLSLVETEKTVDLSEFHTRCERDSIILTDGLEDSLVFYYVLDNTPFLKKVFIFDPHRYSIGLRIVSLDTDENKLANGLKIHFDSGLSLTEKDERDELAYVRFVSMLGENFERMRLKDVKEEKSSIEGRIKWAGVTSKYFLFFILAEDTLIKKVTQWKIEKKRIAFSVSTKEVQKANFLLYFGPINYYQLKDMGNMLEKSVYFGWDWIAPISKIIFFIIIGIHKAIPNYGFVIMVFSIIMMVVFFPLTFKSHASMRRMQKLQPKMEAVRKKHKDDSQKMNAEIMKLYKQNKVNPLGGCLPLLFQMPVFFALYAVLRSTIELRGAPFILWIQDLSVKDPYFILPILMGAAMFVQQKFTVTDPRQKAMTYFMPIFLVFIFSRLPSGIVLYWFVYNLLSIFQQYLIRRGEHEDIVKEPEMK